MSDRWVDLGEVIPVVGYGVHMMTVVTDEGVGQACLIRLLDQEDEKVHEFLLDPDLAAQLGWEMNGAASNLIEPTFGDRLLPDGVALEMIARKYGIDLDDDEEF
jgi:hypothetical protein